MDTQFGRAISTNEFEEPFQGILDNVLDKVRLLYDSLREYMRRPWGTRPLEIVIVDNPSLNAVVTVQNGADRIYLFRGAVERIHGTMLGLLSSPRFIPEVGDAKAEVQPTELNDAGFPPMPLIRRDSDHLAPMGVYIPNDDTRGVFAQMLADVALEFLMFHELGHIAAGHLELCGAYGIDMPITEFKRAFAESEPDTLSHVLECDADAFACHVSSYVQTRPEMAEILRELTNAEHWRPEDFALITYLLADCPTDRANALAWRGAA